MIDNKTIRKVIMLNKLLPSGSPTYEDREASGAVANFTTNTVQPFVKCECEILPVQDPHGYSKLWVAGAGKNICDLNTKSPTTSATVNLEVKTDNEIIMNGTATGGTCDLLVSLKKNIIFDGVNPLTISLTGTDVRTANLNVYLRKIDNTFSSPYGILTDRHYVTIPTSFSGEVKEIMFRISRDESVNIDAKVQIEQGSTATTYEPYTGSTYTVTLEETAYGGSVDVIAGTGQIIDEHGNLVYTLFEPVSISALEGVNNVWTDVGNTKVTYKYKTGEGGSTKKKYLPIFYDFYGKGCRHL